MILNKTPNRIGNRNKLKPNWKQKSLVGLD